MTRRSRKDKPADIQPSAEVGLPQGVRVGHADDRTGLTGCTVVLFDSPASCWASVRGSAPATANFSLFDPFYSSNMIDGIFLTGGSVFGLTAAIGVQRFLEDRGQGFDVGVTSIPRVPAAAIFDLAVGDYTSRPTAQMALSACLSACAEFPPEGSVGAGCGATIGKFLGVDRAMRGGFGAALIQSPAGARVLALAVVNAFGDVWEPGRRRLVAGARQSPEGLALADAAQLIKSGWRRIGFGAASRVVPPGGVIAEFAAGEAQGSFSNADNTTLVALITDAGLDPAGLAKVADHCHFGIADVTHPSHTIYDGDLALAASVGSVSEDLTALCLSAQAAVGEAILRGVGKATAALTIPCAADLG